MKNNNKLVYFAPPRDASDPIKNRFGKPVIQKFKDYDGVVDEIRMHRTLTQTNLLLICPNGHLSDIPWSNFLKLKSKKEGNAEEKVDLFESESCCPQPNLKWSESTTRSEGYASIYIECKNCGGKVNLEGINNLSPMCPGEKPWEIEIDKDGDSIPKDHQCRNFQGNRSIMQVSLATANNVYFSNGFTSLYIPQYLAEGIGVAMADTLAEYELKYRKYLGFKQDTSRKAFAKEWMTSENLIDDGYSK